MVNDATGRAVLVVLDITREGINTDLGVRYLRRAEEKTKLSIYVGIYGFKEMENQCGESSNNLDCGIRCGANKAVDYKQGDFFSGLLVGMLQGYAAHRSLCAGFGKHQ